MGDQGKFKRKPSRRKRKKKIEKGGGGQPPQSGRFRKTRVTPQNMGRGKGAARPPQVLGAIKRGLEKAARGFGA